MGVRHFRGRKQAIGIGLGVALAGAVALAARYGLRRTRRAPIPEGFSPAIFARRLVSTTHGEMVYHVSGSGAPAVFLHGIYPGASSFEWSRVYPRFVMGREVLVPDLIGFGESERPEMPMDASDYAESLADFLREACGAKPAAIMASGATAAIALLLASRHPERVERLALLVPDLDSRRPRWTTSTFALAARLPGLGRFLYEFFLARDPFLSSWIARFGYANPPSPEDQVPAMLAACAQQAGAGHAMLSAIRGRLTVDLNSRFERIPQPVLILAGEDHPALGLAGRFTAGTVGILPRCGELAALEFPDEVAGALSPMLLGPSEAAGAA